MCCDVVVVGGGDPLPTLAVVPVNLTVTMCLPIQLQPAPLLNPVVKSALLQDPVVKSALLQDPVVIPVVKSALLQDPVVIPVVKSALLQDQVVIPVVKVQDKLEEGNRDTEEDNPMTLTPFHCCLLHASHIFYTNRDV